MVVRGERSIDDYAILEDLLDRIANLAFLAVLASINGNARSRTGAENVVLSQR